MKDLLTKREWLVTAGGGGGHNFKRMNLSYPQEPEFHFYQKRQEELSLILNYVYRMGLDFRYNYPISSLRFFLSLMLKSPTVGLIYCKLHKILFLSK